MARERLPLGLIRYWLGDVDKMTICTNSNLQDAGIRARCRATTHFEEIKQHYWGRIFKVIIFCFILILPMASFAESNKEIEKCYNLSLSLQKKGLYTQAEDLLSKGISKFPKARKLYVARGHLRSLSLNKIIEAIEDYSIAIKLDYGKSAKVIYRRGRCFYALGLYKNSISDLTLSLKLLPGYSKAFMERAKAYAKLGELAKAKSDLQSAVKYGPKFENAARELWEKFLTGDTNY
jgi:tetratricopeptide (TPR) repeat protein